MTPCVTILHLCTCWQRLSRSDVEVLEELSERDFDVLPLTPRELKRVEDMMERAGKFRSAETIPR